MKVDLLEMRILSDDGFSYPIHMSRIDSVSVLAQTSLLHRGTPIVPLAGGLAIVLAVAFALKRRRSAVPPAAQLV